MLIGIIIGFILRGLLDYGKELIAMIKHAKVMKAKGEKVEIDYVNLKILNYEEKEKKEKAYKRETIGFHNKTDGD